MRVSLMIERRSVKTSVLPVLLILFFVLFASNAARAQDEARQILDAVVELNAVIPADARTARGLGTFRRGNGILIDDSGLVLTIGYLVLEAERISLVRADGKSVPAEYVAYDYDTGFGLVRAQEDLGARAIPFGDSSRVAERDRMLVVSSGGSDATIGAVVVSRRTFAGYWEYMLEDAIFTSPPHRNWGGAALISSSGELMGVGSLFVRDARNVDGPVPGNMFVPINLLKPILGDMLTIGRGGGADKPWLGIFSQELFNFVVITRVTDGGPAERAGILRGDVIVSVGGHRVSKQIDFYRSLWAQGGAGTDVRLGILRQGKVMEFEVHSGSRYDFVDPDRAKPDSF